MKDLTGEIVYAKINAEPGKILSRQNQFFRHARQFITHLDKINTVGKTANIQLRFGRSRQTINNNPAHRISLNNMKFI